MPTFVFFKQEKSIAIPEGILLLVDDVGSINITIIGHEKQA